MEKSPNLVPVTMLLAVLLTACSVQVEGHPPRATLSAPRDLFATPGNGSIGLSWKAPDIGAITVAGYRVSRSTTGSEPSIVGTVPSDTLYLKDIVANGIPYVYTVRAFNPIEEGPESEPVTASGDGTPPTIFGISPEDGGVLGGDTLDLSWSSSDDGSGIDRFELSVNEDIVYSGRSSSITLSLSEGANRLILRAFDLAGNMAERTLTYTMDQTDPLVTIHRPNEGTFHPFSTLVLEWDVEELHFFGAEAFIDGRRLPSLGPAEPRELGPLSEGPHSVIVSVTDSAENVGTAISNFTVDTAAPEIRVRNLRDGQMVNVSGYHPDLTVTDEDPVIVIEILVNGDRIDEVRPGSLPTLQFIEGENDIEFRATDRAGNEGVLLLSVVLDSIAPTIRFKDIPDGPIRNDGSHVVSWEAKDRDGTGLDSVFLSIDGRGRQKVDPVGELSIGIRSEGHHIVEITAYDLAGNMGTGSTEFILDSTPPAFLFVEPSEGVLDPFSTILFEFSEPMDPAFSSVHSENATGMVTWEGTKAIFSPGSPLPIGDDIVFTLQGQDLAGNGLAPTIVVVGTVDEGYIEGKVLDPDGSPVKDVTVILDNGRTARTDGEGSFNLTAPIGDRTVIFRGADRVRIERSVRVYPGRTSVVGVVQLEKEEAGPLLSRGSLARVLAVILVLSSVGGAITFLVFQIRRERFED